MAECHPVGFRWVMKARERGATIIHVDPRFTRTSAVANIHVPIRAGIGYRVSRRHHPLHLENERYFKEYVVNYTNAPAIIGETFETRRTWMASSADGTRRRASTTQRPGRTKVSTRSRPRASAKRVAGKAEPMQRQPIQAEHTDPTLQHPRCVFQILKRHFSRYTPEMVEKACGIPQELFLKVAETLCQQFRPREHGGVLLRGGLDAALRRRAVHSHGRDHSIAAGKHRTAGRRHHGAARARFHSGLDRHPDALQPAAGYLPMPKANTIRICRRTYELNAIALRLVGRVSQVLRLAHEGMVRRARPRKRTTGATTTCRR